jgi:hypothetical protein
VRIIVTRVDAKRYATVVERDDGVRLSVPGYGFMRELPHDLAHYAVESTLRLDSGFWGSIASGAKLRGMQLLGGRQKPHADERAKTIEKTNASFLSEAEGLVACFDILAGQNSPKTGRWERAEAMDRIRVRGLTPGQISEIGKAWAAVQRCWDAVPIGEAIALDWPAPRSRRHEQKPRSV